MSGIDLKSILEREIRLEAIPSPGPGGQNVNKVATAVQLRFDAAGSPSLPPEVRERLLSLAGRRATREGHILITAHRSRSQDQNRADAILRLVDLIERARVRPRLRRPTRPTRASQERRLEVKRRRSLIKRGRSGSSDD